MLVGGPHNIGAGGADGGELPSITRGAWETWAADGHLSDEDLPNPTDVVADDLLLVMYCGAGGTVIRAAPTGWNLYRSLTGFPAGLYARIADGTSTDHFTILGQVSTSYGAGQMARIRPSATFTSFGGTASGTGHTGALSTVADYGSQASTATSGWNLVGSVLIRTNYSTDLAYGPPASIYTQIDEVYTDLGAQDFNVVWAYKLDQVMDAISAVLAGEDPSGNNINKYGGTGRLHINT